MPASVRGAIMRRIRTAGALAAIVVLSAIAAHVHTDGHINTLTAVQQPVNAAAMSAAPLGDLSSRLP
jgi:hypothetical protein